MDVASLLRTVSIWNGAIYIVNIVCLSDNQELAHPTQEYLQRLCYHLLTSWRLFIDKLTAEGDKEVGGVAVEKTLRKGRAQDQ